MKLTTRIHLVMRLRKSGSIFPFHSAPPRLAKRHIFFNFLHSVPSFLFRLEAGDTSRIMSLLHSNLLLLKIMAGQYADHREVFATFLHLNSFRNEI